MTSTAAKDAAAPQVRHESLSLVEVLGQSLANTAPTLTPAINISIVAGLAGVGSWASYLIATVAMLFVASSICTLAQRHPLAGSFFVYVGRTFGPLAGLIAGWSMMAAYLATAAAAVLTFSIFVGNVLGAFWPSDAASLGWIEPVALMALVWQAAHRDIRLSSRLGLVLETFSFAIVLSITLVAIAAHGTVLDHAQFDPTRLKLGSVMSGLTFAVFSFVGFESAATLAKESRDATRMIPVVLRLSVAILGLFFFAMTYCMILVTGDDAGVIGNSNSPFLEFTDRAGLRWVGSVFYASAAISCFACALASVNAVARIIFSMGRHGFLDRSMGVVHARHRTPHRAVAFSCMVILASTLALLPFGLLDGLKYAGTFGTFGFLVVYLLICVASPVDLRREGAMRTRHAVVGAAGAVLMALVIFGSLVPVPPWPGNVIPYLFAAYLAAGIAWFALLRRRGLAAVGAFERDLEA